MIIYNKMKIFREILYWVSLVVLGAFLGLIGYFLISRIFSARVTPIEFISAEDDLSQSAQNQLTQPQTLVFMPESPINSFPVPPEGLNIFRVRTVTILGGNFSTIPDSVSLWAQSPLNHLTVSYSGVTRVSEEIGDLISLDTLDLSGNNLSVLPERVSDLQNLTMLNVANNRLSYLPDSIGSMTNLRVLDVRSNNLSFLPDLSSLKKLTHLFVGDNPISREDIILLQPLLPNTAIFY